MFLPAFISLILVFKASMNLRKIINFINLISILLLFPSLALPVTSSYSEHMYFIVCVRGSVVLNKSCSVPVGA